MAGRFTAGGRTYTDTPAGHLEAARDRVADTLWLRGHEMKHWHKQAGARPPYFSAECVKCGAGVKVVTGRAPMNLPGYPSLVRLRRVQYCPGKPGRR
jgi:hypothetical protein